MAYRYRYFGEEDRTPIVDAQIESALLNRDAELAAMRLGLATRPVKLSRKSSKDDLLTLIGRLTPEQLESVLKEL